MRVIDSGVEFYGDIELKEPSEINQKILVLALKNLCFAGAKRNRGCGKIVCTILNENKISRKLLKEVI